MLKEGVVRDSISSQVLKPTVTIRGRDKRMKQGLVKDSISSQVLELTVTIGGRDKIVMVRSHALPFIAACSDST